MIKKFSIPGLFLIGLIYLILPGPSSINDIPALPKSLKSDEPGDTTQAPNIAAYFSNYQRIEVTDFYKQAFKNLHFLKLPPERFNHPPEESFVYIRDQQPSTYLEEYSYPLRGSLFVNGFEPFNENGKPYKRGATSIVVSETFFDSKTTLRFYNSNVFWRIAVYLGIWFGLISIVKLFKKSLR